ncbi:hypothetical protein PUR34_00955, partial [Streptomyces sp. JV185]|nr:hypothetical protein [Streptomyces sp. JV185]
SDTADTATSDADTALPSDYREVLDPIALIFKRSGAEALKVRLDDLHRAKIRLYDEWLLVGDYIGDSTRGVIGFARSVG